MHEALIRSLRLAVEAAPDDIPLRVHLGRMLLDAGLFPEAMLEAARVLGTAPQDDGARQLMSDLLGTRVGEQSVAPTIDAQPSSDNRPVADVGIGGSRTGEHPNDMPSPEQSEAAPQSEGFDWDAAERQIVADGAFRIERPALRLSDVGGMHNVKLRLESAFLAPLRNPELRRLYAKSLRGGLLMYGPPGCGKTFVARALAGELDANFLTVGLTDLLDPYLGVSERNVREAFDAARRHTPCILFIDEIDAVGQRRGQAQGGVMRGIVNQLLTEMDGIANDNDGVFVLGATNRPWDVEPALRRPGRFDRTVLVLPPDEPARRAIIHSCLADRPAADADADEIALVTEGFSGADLAYLCELAAEGALMDSITSNTPRQISTADLAAAAKQVVPSATDWLSKARNVIRYGVDDGTYDELRAHLDKKRRR